MSRSTTARVSTAIVTMLLAVLVGACAANKPPAQKVNDAESGEPKDSLAEAEALFDAAEQELGGMLTAAGGVPMPKPGLASDPAPPPAPSPRPTTMPGPPRPSPVARPDSLQSSPWPDGAGALRVDRCTRACRALASMQRAADKVCELAGESDRRCKSVRARVSAARDIVLNACPDCTA